MMDTRRTGMRCRVKKMVRSHAATIQPAEHGTITSEVEKLGRRLILVQWDGGPSVYAFPDEIEIVGAMDQPQFFDSGGESHGVD